MVPAAGIVFATSAGIEPITATPRVCSLFAATDPVRPTSDGTTSCNVRVARSDVSRGIEGSAARSLVIREEKVSAGKVPPNTGETPSTSSSG